MTIEKDLAKARELVKYGQPSIILRTDWYRIYRVLGSLVAEIDRLSANKGNN